MLYGKPLGYSCSNGPTKTNERKNRLSDALVLVIIIIDAAAGVGIILTVGWCCYIRSKSTTWARTETSGFDNRKTREREEEMVMFEGCKGFSKVDDLLKAFAEMLGKGSVGSTYKVVVDSDGGGARVREWLRRKDIDGLMKEIGGLRHVNIVSLRAYYFSRDELLLVYDFLPNGSLHSLLPG